MSTVAWEQKVEHLLYEMAKRSHEIQAGFAEIQRGFTEIEQKFTELTDQVKQHETQRERDRKELEAQRERDYQEFINTRKEVGQISQRLGRIVEDLIAPDLGIILRELVNCPNNGDLIVVNTRVQRKLRGTPLPGQRQMIELDAMAECGNYLIINETKSTLRPEHVRHLLELLPQIRTYFPEYEHYQIIGCVASLQVADDLIQYATRQGIVVLAMKEGLIKAVNQAELEIRYF